MIFAIIVQPYTHVVVGPISQWHEISQRLEVKRDYRRKTNGDQSTLSAGSPGMHSASQGKTKYKKMSDKKMSDGW